MRFHSVEFIPEICLRSTGQISFISAYNALFSVHFTHPDLRGSEYNWYRPNSEWAPKFLSHVIFTNCILKCDCELVTGQKPEEIPVIHTLYWILEAEKDKYTNQHGPATD